MFTVFKRKNVFSFLVLLWICILFNAFRVSPAYGSSGDKPTPDSLTYDSLKKARINEMNYLKKEFNGYPVETILGATFDNADTHWKKFFFHEGTYPAGSKEDFDKAKLLQVIGPFVIDSSVAIYELAERRTMADSVMLRHILVAYKGVAWSNFARTKAQAKSRADSLQEVIASGKTKMEDLVMSFSDDPGSKEGNLGSYGWTTVTSGVLEEYSAVGFNNPVGKTVVIDTMYGYYVVQVVAKSKEYQGVLGYGITEPVVWHRGSR